MNQAVEFTGHYADMSSDVGFQWEFSCSRCFSAHRSTYQANPLAQGRGLLRSLGDLVGGPLQRLSQAADDFSRMWGSQASLTRDHAFSAAVEQAKLQFRHCPGCGHWVCATACWNTTVGQCQDCSPAIEQETARVQAQARRNQLFALADQQTLTTGTILDSPARLSCDTCGSPAFGRFCSSCGNSLNPDRRCHTCGHHIALDALYCCNCGTSQ
jgi:hypothetical protein